MQRSERTAMMSASVVRPEPIRRPVRTSTKDTMPLLKPTAAQVPPASVATARTEADCAVEDTFMSCAQRAIRKSRNLHKQQFNSAPYSAECC
jgi:hypothetical protein